MNKSINSKGLSGETSEYFSGAWKDITLKTIQFSFILKDTDR